MTFNLTVNESGGSTPQTPGNFNVRAFYNENDAGQVFGTFTSMQAAENCVNVLAGRSDVLRAVIETI